MEVTKNKLLAKYWEKKSAQIHKRECSGAVEIPHDIKDRQIEMI